MALTWVKIGNLKGPKGDVGPQGVAGNVSAWKASTAYISGQTVVSPGGDLVTAKTGFTSSSSYSASNWNASAQDGRIGAVETNATFRRGVLPNGTDLNTLAGVANAGIWSVTSTTNVATMINAPSITDNQPYTLEVRSTTNGITNQTIIPYNTGFAIFTRAANNTAGTSWLPWKKVAWDDGNTPLKLMPTLTDGANLNSLTVTGTYPINSTTVAPTLVNAPSILSGFYEVLTTTNGITNQRFTEYSTNKIFNRITKSVQGGTWTDWREIGTPSSGGGSSTPSDAGLVNSLLIQDWSRRMGGRKKVTTATVAFRFDHGLANFDTKIRAELESRNFKYSLALCSGQWDRSENVGVTASMVNGWVTGGLAEIWNHSKDHGSGDNSEAQWKAAILDGLTELRAQIPAAQIDGFAPPGSAGTNFGGFLTGTTLEQFYATDGGKFILSNHAVSSGYLPAATRWQDGMVRHGMGHYTLDSYTLAQAQAAIQSAETGKRAVQFMLHPSLLDGVDGMATATFVSILNYVQAEVTAGRLKVVGPYEQLLTDVV